MKRDEKDESTICIKFELSASIKYICYLYKCWSYKAVSYLDSKNFITQ